MDSLTQIALGSCVAAACVPAPQRRQAAVLGAVLGTLPDLDVLLDYGDPVANFTMHRGFSHSLAVLALAGVVLWLVLKNWTPVRQAPSRWLAAILLALLTHPLLDAHTAYGTQLFWPMGWTPVSWATIFIIDPLYSLPLIAGMLAVMIRPASHAAGRWLAAGLVLSSLYLGWSWTAKAIVTQNAQESLEARGIQGARLFVTPTPFNTLLWKVVARTEGGYYEGLNSVAAKQRAMDFSFHPSRDEILASAGNFPSVRRLLWFSGGFVGASIEDDQLILSDLRMGQHPNYVFRHAVARRGNPHWQEIEPERLRSTISLSQLKTLWEKIRTGDDRSQLSEP
jgi:inner membrane protein